MAMVIGSVDKSGSALGAQIGNAGMDARSKSIQKQIANKQKELQELSSNEELSLEEKMKKRQEINQEINNLNLQLRQHQMEARREAQQKKGNSMDEMPGGSGQRKDQAGKKSGAGMSTASMQAIISADMSMDQVRTQGSVKTGLEGWISVLEEEIKLDGGRGSSVEKKEAELADLQDKSADVSKEQMGALSDIHEELRRAGENGTDEETSGETAEETKNRDAQRPKSQEANGADRTESVSGQEASTEELPGAQTGSRTAYAPVDIRL